LTDLPAALRALAARAEHGALPPAVVDRLAAALACERRDAALRRAAELLDPAGELSRNRAAERASAALRRFEAGA
jgi:hypothetical protein